MPTADDLEQAQEYIKSAITDAEDFFVLHGQGRHQRVTRQITHQCLYTAIASVFLAAGHGMPQGNWLPGLMNELKAKQPNWKWEPESDLHEVVRLAQNLELEPEKGWADLAMSLAYDVKKLEQEYQRLTGEQPQRQKEHQD